MLSDRQEIMSAWLQCLQIFRKNYIPMVQISKKKDWTTEKSTASYRPDRERRGNRKFTNLDEEGKKCKRGNSA